MSTKNELLQLKGVISDLPEDQQKRVKDLSKTLMDTLKAADIGDACIAAGLFGLEFTLFIEDL